jgi:phosphatidylethanolamine-binding protein (PEBP) family uncharacterized protein
MTPDRRGNPFPPRPDLHRVVTRVVAKDAATLRAAARHRGVSLMAYLAAELHQVADRERAANRKVRKPQPKGSK